MSTGSFDLYRNADIGVGYRSGSATQDAHGAIHWHDEELRSHRDVRGVEYLADGFWLFALSRQGTKRQPNAQWLRGVWTNPACTLVTCANCGKLGGPSKHRQHRIVYRDDCHGWRALGEYRRRDRDALYDYSALPAKAAGDDAILCGTCHTKIRRLMSLCRDYQESRQYLGRITRLLQQKGNAHEQDQNHG